MKYLIFTLALISAFFVSSEPDMSDLLSPSIHDGRCMANDLTKVCGSNDVVQVASMLCQASIPLVPLEPSDGITWDSVVCYQNRSNFILQKVGYRDDSPETIVRADYLVNTYFVDSYSCPPVGSPSHTIEVPNPNTEATPNFLCAKEFVPPLEPDPDAKCDEFGNNSMLPPKDGVGTPGQTACYTNPTTGKSCQYSQGHDNFTATGKDCDGDENDYGDKPTPQPPPEGNDDNCYDYGSLGGVLICDVDPNQGCNALLINGQTQYQCPPGCGSMDGVYFCTYDDLDGDGKADDKNGNGVPDKDETCVNGRCTPNPDSNETPNPDAPDMTQTNNKLDGIKGELGFVGGKLDKTNQALDGINSGIQGLKKSQDKSNGLLTDVEKNTKLTAGNTDAIAGNTKGILDTLSETDVGNTFNPDSSSSFYESSYENGFQGVWDEKSELISQTGLFVFLKQFRLTSGGSAPEMNICFDVLVNLGCKTLDPNWERLMPFLKLCIFITTAFVCRRIIFGG